MTQTQAPFVRELSPSSVELLDDLETLIGDGRRLPFSASVVINEDEALELVDRARLGLPQELIEARHTVVDRTRIIGAAEEEAELLLSRAEQESAALLTAARADAEAMLAEARRQAAVLVDQSEIVRLAQERAAEVATKAEAAAMAIRTEADGYARQVMEELDGHLTRALGTVRKGLETLAQPGNDSRRRKRG